MPHAPAAQPTLADLEWLRPVVDAVSPNESEACAERLRSALSSVGVHDEAIASQALFDRRRYVRRTIHESERMQVLVIGWLPGQSSEIHDHAGSLCGFRVVRGVAAESIYVPRDEGVHETVRVVHRRGEVVVSGERDIHRMWLEPGADEPLVTLHVYAPPLRMRVYHEQTASA